MNHSCGVAMRSLVSWRGALAGALMAAVGVLGCEGESKPPEASKPEIEVSSPVTDSVADFEVFTGRTQSIHNSDIRARVTGYLESAPFTEGEDVKKGDILFKIDDRPYEAMLAQAVADVSLAESHFQSMQDIYARDVKAAVRHAGSDHYPGPRQSRRSQSDYRPRQGNARRPLSRTSITASSGRPSAAGSAGAMWTPTTT